MKTILLSIILAFSAININAEKREAYEAILINVENSVDGNNINDNDASLNNEIGDNNFNISSYSDSKIDVSWIFHPTHLSFTLLNKGNSTIKVLWDDAAFIDGSNSSHPVFHNGITINDRDKEQKPTSIVKKSQIDDRILLSDKVGYMKVVGRWVFSYINEIVKDGEEMKVLLPLEINGEINEYLFTFKLVNLNVKGKASLRGDGTWIYQPLKKRN
ncbi:hypothetical protein M1P97_09125 [Parabacteroides sp. GYB001]|uniref:hypothetical protein n=1 Tax=Parabacteroides leei TaxID=2939491 RepID=UPI00201735BA|nr:hypothetical protein [Parabacteroides leei]MCL3851446.1 hypothetical protein [Parabacteroides leei]